MSEQRHIGDLSQYPQIQPLTRLKSSRVAQLFLQNFAYIVFNLEQYFSAILTSSKIFLFKSIVSCLAEYKIFAIIARLGEVSEWLKEHAWKVCIRFRVSRVRIPLSPPNSIFTVVHRSSKSLILKRLSFFYV